MITSVRSVMIHDGKTEEGVGWALKVRKYVNETFDSNVQVWRNVTGHEGQLHWVANYDSLADLETATKKKDADAGYQKMIKEAREQNLFALSRLVTNLYETVS